MNDEYYYKDRVTELQNINSFVRKNTLGSVLNRLKYLKENGGDIDHAIELVISMMKE